MGSRYTYDETSPFVGSPKGTPRSFAGMRSISGLGIPTPVESIKQALVHSRNELVLLFSRCDSLFQLIVPRFEDYNNLFRIVRQIKILKS